ncbi:UPF0603 protein, chloroplastic [Capsicum annuum]|nr:UPF0603 protein, chloroplastic [Capsicum annuum]KAF3656963.1 putative E3 ubiquitin-protein ligase ATL6 isoform 1 [Capsicum annuum]
METILSPPFSPLFNPKTSLCKPFLSLPHLPKSTSAKPICCSLRKHYSQVEKDSFSIPKSWVSHVQQGLAALAISLALNFCPVVSSGSALASEFDVLNEGPPKDSYLVDDAGVLSRVTKSDLKALLSDVEKRKGFHINFITVRKLTSKADAFEYADQVLEKWYPSIEEGNNKGIVVLVTSQKEGAITGGPEFIKAVGDTVLDATVSENLPGRKYFLPVRCCLGALISYVIEVDFQLNSLLRTLAIILATEEKYNEAVFSTARRLVAAIDGLPDPGGPQVKDNKRESNFKSREETDEKRGQFTLVVGGLLVIAFVVPMAQYYAYVSKK